MNTNGYSNAGTADAVPGGHPAHAEATLPATPDSVSKARRLLDRWPETTASEMARLVVSELVGNQILHGSPDGPLTVSISHERDGMRVQVEGPSGATVPTELPHDPRRLSGRGLAIVSRACDAWGWDARAGRTRVWGLVGPSGGSPR